MFGYKNCYMIVNELIVEIMFCCEKFDYLFAEYA